MASRRPVGSAESAARTRRTSARARGEAGTSSGVAGTVTHSSSMALHGAGAPGDGSMGRGWPRVTPPLGGASARGPKGLECGFRMTDESTLPATRAPEPHTGEEDLVQLDQNHPGFRDPVYRQRRNAIAQRALRWHVGDPMPEVDYSTVEHSVWRTVWEH